MCGLILMNLRLDARDWSRNGRFANELMVYGGFCSFGRKTAEGKGGEKLEEGGRRWPLLRATGRVVGRAAIFAAAFLALFRQTGRGNVERAPLVGYYQRQ